MERTPMHPQDPNNISLATQRMQAPPGVQGPQMVIRPNVNQVPSMTPQRMQAPQMVTSQRMQPPTIAMQPQRMQAPQIGISSQAIQTQQAPPIMVVTEGMQMSTMVMTTHSSQMAQGMSNPPMVMQTPPMMVTSQGMQVSQMVMTSQGLQQPPIMMTPQGMQAPQMVIATQGMPTTPLIVTSQGMQNIPVTSQKMQVPTSIQMVPRGQMMMGPPRPPSSHGQGELQPRALMGQLRQPGMMMAPRGVPHPRMFNPEGMHLMPRQPGMFPFRGTIPMSFGTPTRQQIPIQLNPQEQQIITSQPTQIIPMSMG